MVLGFLAPLCFSQDEAPPAPVAPASIAPAATSALEQYLEDRGLRELLAAYLSARLKTMPEGPARVALADRIGEIYGLLLESAATPDARKHWEDRGEELLRGVPEAESFDLRLRLARVRFLQAEIIAERRRVRLARPDEVKEATGVMKASAALFHEIGIKAHKRVEALERREASGRDEDTRALRESLGKSRGHRSMAMFYAGWSNYYLTLLTGSPATADEALQELGAVLTGAVGRPANVEKMSTSLLKLPHVARAAVGVALAESVRGQVETALRWLEVVENAEDVDKDVVSQVFARRMTILGAAKRWADLELIVRRARQPGGSGPPKPLGVREARLLAVMTFESIDERTPTKRGKEAIANLAEIAMGDLISLGESQQVLSLTSLYGTAALDGKGFIVSYVRGLQAYNAAEAAHKAAGQPDTEPTSSSENATKFREAASNFELALAADDRQRFPNESTNASLLLGLSLFYAGELEKAADRFEETHRTAATPAQAQDALWLATIAVNRAMEDNKPSLKPRFLSLSGLFLRTYPNSDMAAKLLVRMNASGAITDEAVVDILLAVKPESAVYEAARREAGNVLYRLFKRKAGEERSFYALKFMDIGEELIRLDRRRMTDGAAADSEPAVQSALINIRRVLDAALGSDTPDLDRAGRAFEELANVAAYKGLDLTKVGDELTYRRMVYAAFKGDNDAALAELDRLHQQGGPFSEAADRFMFRRARNAWARQPESAAAGREVVRHGMRLIDTGGKDQKSLRSPTTAALYNEVAAAAAAVWRAELDPSMRDTARRLDGLLIAAGARSEPVLRRYAELSESVGMMSEALDAWRTLMAGLPDGTTDWFRARYESLRVLLAIDPARAREAMDQHKLLRPSYGPSPWGERLRELDEQIRLRTPAAAAPSTPPPATGGGG